MIPFIILLVAIIVAALIMFDKSPQREIDEED